MNKVEAKLIYNIEQRYYMMYALHDVSMANSMIEHVRINQNMIGTANGVSNQSLKRKKRSYLKHASYMIKGYKHNYNGTLDDYSKQPSDFTYYHLVVLYGHYSRMVVKYMVELPVEKTTTQNSVALYKTVKNNKTLNPIIKDFALSYLKDIDGNFIDSQYITNQVYDVLLLAKSEKSLINRTPRQYHMKVNSKPFAMR